MISKKLVHKLTILSIVPVIISMILFGSISYTIYKDQLIHQRIEEARSLILLSSHEMENPLYFVQLDKLNAIIGNIKENDNVIAVFVLDTGGKVITDGTYENRFYGQIMTDDFSERSIKSTESTVVIENNVIRISAPVFITEKIGTIMIHFSLKELDTVLMNLIILLVVIGTIIVIVISGINFSVSNTISKPVTDLRDATNEIAKGNFRARIEKRSDDEIGELAGTFNKMAEDLQTSSDERRQAEQRMTRLNECLLGFGADPVKNINSLTALCGELMGASCALYNRLENGTLCSLGQWNTPPGYKSVDDPEGHICSDVINRCENGVIVIHNLPETEYAHTDPNILPNKLKTYIGKSVKFSEKCVGSLCVVYQDDFSPGEDDKRLMGVIASAIGVEEKRRQAEEALKRLSSAVDQSGDSVIITNKKANIEYVNPAFEKLTGFSLAEVIGKNPNFLKSGKHDKKFYNELNDTITSGSAFSAEIINKKKNSELFISETTIMPIRDMQGNITHFVTTSKDITERRKSEKMRIENEQLALASKAKSEFLANMSHELRTPLNSIIGFSELMEMNTSLDNAQKHYLENVITSGKFLLNLINDILDLSKVEAGKIELVIDKINVPSFIAEILILIKEKASKQNVILKKELDPALSYIEADQRRLKQILFNLLSNAVKFSKSGGGTVTITARKEGDTAKFSISDTGIGIRDGDMDKLFSAFEQLDSGITKKYGGTGLGLAITKKLVELHGGRITVDSRYDEGSTFTFTLPIEAEKNGVF
ncbi:MAG: ATP-binding protein [Candidatus Methanoperedens sp.]|nr:ATP-binding protein [Candidatus Methanoperedens sp.]